ncbi:MAG: dipeptidase PepV [Armatimonadaceae bacterium]
MKSQIEAWVDAHAEEIIAETQAILRIPSVTEHESVGPDAPFGRPIADALEHTLAVCEHAGMTVQNFGGYAGHADFGNISDDAEIVAMLGHLDVVPVGSGWTMDPWGGEVKDGFLYARGSADDKGPTYAALFGARAVLELCQENGVSLSRKIRLIFGCDEESGWLCMEHYFGAAGQPKPTLAFTPDATFPVVFAEKGSFTAVLEKSIAPEAANDEITVRRFQSGLRPNMVPDRAVAVLAGSEGALQQATLILSEREGVRVEQGSEGLLVYAEGKSAHGARPFIGINAAMRLLNALAETPGMAQSDTAWMTDLAARGATDGSGIGIAGQDEITTPLTANLGIVHKEADRVQATFNIRYPATWDGDDTLGKFTDSVSETHWTVAEMHHTPALYVPPENEPVQTCLRVYRDFTGDMQAPRTMGGRTYATTVAPVGVAFGAALPGEPEVAHQADEHFSVERLLLCAKIYGTVLYELAK